MSLLKSEPAEAVRSIDELFAIAHAMEQEAATRYAEIANRLRAEGSPSLADVFERLSAEERGHLASVAHWSEKERGREPDPDLVRWTLPETFDDEGAKAAGSHMMTAYKALSMAVRNEERAFAFWTYVAAHAEKPEIRGAAERMAREELDHVATLRRERRRAFHAERSAQPRADAGPLAAADLERRLADTCRRSADSLAPAEAARLRGFAAEAEEAAQELAREPARFVLGSNALGEVAESPVAMAELLVEHYLEAAERASDDAALARAQAFAGRAIERLAWLRSDLPEIERR